MTTSTLEYEVKIDVLTRRNAELEAALKKAEARADHEHAGRHLATAAAAAGVLPQAIGDAVSRAMTGGQWKSDKLGRLTRYNSEGFPELIGSEPVTPKLAVEALRHDAPHLWPEDGTAPAPRPAPQTAPQAQKTPAFDATDNPWTKGSENITRQSEIIRTNPDLAKKMAVAAGAKVTAHGFSKAR